MIEVIPAIDIIEGKCVRLTNGDYDQKKIYNENPLEVAMEFEDSGIKRLHLVDLDGAKTGQVKNWKVLEKVTSKTSLQVDFGGGIKTDNDLNIVFNSGAIMATIGSIAVSDQELFDCWIKKYGAIHFFLGADVKDEKITINGWQEITDLDVFEFIQSYVERGIINVFCTDVSKDGVLQGPSLELYKKLNKKFPVLNLVASGGVSSIDDILKLQEAGCKGVIIGKAIYEGKIRLKELKQFL